MRFKYLIFMSLVLTILTLSSACASDNCDNLTMDDDVESVAVDDVDVVEVSNDHDDLSTSENEVVGEGDLYLHHYLYYPVKVIANTNSKIDFAVYSDSPGATGNVSLYIDDNDEPIYNQPVKYYRENSYDIITEGNFIYLKDYKFEYGKHTAILKYTGDDKYKSFSETWNFTYDYMFVDVKPVVYTNFHSDPMTLEIPYDMKGNIKVLFDDEVVLNTNLPSDKFEKYPLGSSLYSIYFDKLNLKQYTYTVTYSNGNYPNKQISGKFNVTYSIINYIENSKGSYYCDDVLKLVLMRPSDGTGDFIVEFDNKTYEVKVDSKTNQGTISFENFTKLGKQDILIKYQDNKYPLKEFVEEIYIYERFNIPYHINYGDKENITLVLPHNATGDLLIYDNNNNLIEKIPLVNGRADYTIPQEIGYYELTAKYNGTFAKIKDRHAYISVIPKVISPKPVNINENYELSVICNDNSSNILKIELENHNTNELQLLYEGVQTSKLFTKEELNINAGFYGIIVTCTFNNSDTKEYYGGLLDIRDSPRQFKILGEMNDINLYLMTTTQFNKASFYITVIQNAPSDGNGKLLLYINDKLAATGDRFSYLMDFSSKLLKKGDNKVVLKYIDDTYYSDSTFTGIIKVTGEFKDKIKKPDVVKLALKKVTVKRSAKKLVLTATLKINGKLAKSKTLKFKFKNKVYKAKTNKKGIAKVTIKKSILKKLKKGKKVTYQVSYGKKVKKVTVKVKK